MEETKTPVTEKTKVVQYRDETLYKILVGIEECEYSNAGNKSGNITIKNVFTTKRLFIENLLEMKLVVVGDKKG